MLINKFQLGVFDENLDERFRVENKIFITLSDKIKTGELFVNLKLTTPVKYDAGNIGDFDWNVNYEKGQNTFLLYLFSLGHVYILTKASNMLKDEKLLDLAIEFVLSFENYDNSVLGTDKCVYCWYDHAVAERAENISYLIYTAIKFKKNSDLIRRITSILDKQMLWLYDDNNYVKNHNHGVIEDKALILSAVFINSDKSSIYIEKAIDRVKGQINFGYTKDFIHFENSVGYHMGMIGFLLTISKLLNMVENKEEKFFENVINGALEYLVYCYKPNKSVPYFGDTLGVEISNEVALENLYIKTYKNNELEYIQTLGKKGYKPKSLGKWFKNSGYVFFREHWNEVGFQNATWLSFKAGYTCSTHKHRDDLSICLYSKGYDIFIDPGMYNYVPGNKISEYMNSNLAHNTIVVDGKDYSITMGNYTKFGILTFQTYDNYDYSVGYNRVNDGVEIFRHIYYIRPSIVVIRDQIISKEKHTYSQLFHLGTKCATRYKDNQLVEVELVGSDIVTYINQISNIDKSLVHYGDSNNILSLNSTGFSNCNKTETIEFKKVGANEEFITIINVDYRKIDYIKTENGIKIGNADIIFKDIESFIYKGLKINSIEKNVIEIENLLLGNNYQYCYYIIEDDSKKVYLKTQYSKDSRINVKIETNKNYTIIYYIKGYGNQILTGIGGKLSYDDMSLTKKVYFDPKDVLNIKEKSIVSCDKERYIFSLNINCEYDYYIKWYIYKDGASYDFVGTENNDKIEYSFIEKGEYTVYYRVRVTYLQEIDFGKFNNIIVK